MIQELEQYSIADLLAAVEAKQIAQTTAALASEQQAIRDQQERVRAQHVADRHSRRNQTPVQWAQCMADTGLPVTTAKIIAEVLAVIYNRLEAVEAAQQPAHLRGVERRNG